MTSGDVVKSARSGGIILVRHGRPDQNRHVWVTATEWAEWWAGYNRAGLAPEASPPAELLEVARDAVHLFSSPLPRAVETANAAFEGRSFAQEDIFVEAPLPKLPIGWIKLTPWAWGAISRVWWALGYSAGGESHKLAKTRADLAALMLIEAVADGGSAMVCGHGWFNRMIRGRLRRRGWKCKFDGGDRYWARRQFVQRS